MLVIVRGEPIQLPAGVDLCVYRVIQEALTNVRKHSRAQRAVVAITYERSSVGVEIRDDGRGSPVRGGHVAGHGLVGMRERVALYGGSLHAGATETGFRVTASIPLEDSR